MKKIRNIQNELIKVSQSWAVKQRFNSANARQLRHEAIFINHSYYLENIPIYRKLVQEDNIREVTDIETLKRKLMLGDGIFKSYNQEWIDSCDFNKMNKWLSSIYHKSVDVDSRGVKSIDEWLEQLETAGIRVTYSSGTSGSFSFVPRSIEDWALAKTANACYLAPLLLNSGVGIRGSRFSLNRTVRSLQPEAFMKIISETGLRGFDAFFLGFKRGRMGNQMLMQEIGPLFRKHYFLHDFDLTASALRCLTHGVSTGDEGSLVESFQNRVSQSYPSYLRFIENIRASVRQGQRIFIFGAPYQFKQFLEFMSDCEKKLALGKGSLVLFGGGWKSFSGESMEREELISELRGAFNLEPQYILEGYSMTEISTLTLRCDHGRFHVPPWLEPVIFNEEWNPIEGDDLRGTFGFLDPFAVSYPGFIISGDFVHLVEGTCPCGLTGPAIIEIGRARTEEIKGCGGIMASINA